MMMSHKLSLENLDIIPQAVGICELPSSETEETLFCFGEDYFNRFRKLNYISLKSIDDTQKPSPSGEPKDLTQG